MDTTETKLMYLVMREPISEYCTPPAEVVARFDRVEEAVAAARAAASPWARVTVRVVGWE